MKKNHLYWLFFFLIFVIGLTIRIVAIIRQPLWLDEQYSLFFSQSLSSSQFFISTPDTHPGLYYFFVKILSIFSSNIYLYRIVSALLPSILGTWILLWTSWRWKKNAKLSLITIFFLLWLNPFLINFSWQLRMYALLLFWLSLSWYFFNQWRETKKTTDFYFLFLSIVLGQATSYIFYFWTLGLLLQNISWKINIQTIKKNSHLLFIFFFGFVQFFVQSFGQVKETFLNVSWISRPNLTNTIALVREIIGSDSKLFLEIVPVLFFECSIIIFVIYTVARILKNSKKNREFIYHVLLSSSTIFCLSFMLHFFANRVFLSYLIPDISLFLSRTFILQYVMFAVLVPPMAKVIFFGKKRLVVGVLLLTFILWSNNYLKFFDPIYTMSHTKDRVNSVKYEEAFFWLPSWSLIELLRTPAMVNKKFINSYTRSQYLEKEVIENINNKNTEILCDVLKNHKIIMKLEVIINTKLKSNELKKTILNCCENRRLDANYELFTCQ